MLLPLAIEHDNDVERLGHAFLQGWLELTLICLTFSTVVKKTQATRKDEQQEKKQELEKRLQDVTGALGNPKKPKKGKFLLKVLASISCWR